MPSYYSHRGSVRGGPAIDPRENAELAPIGKIYGEPILQVPQDLFIPPERLRYFSRPSRARSTCCST